jgi:hypothetical protein
MRVRSRRWKYTAWVFFLTGYWGCGGQDKIREDVRTGGPEADQMELR